MKILKYMKDGGPLSRVWGLFIIEIKPLFSIVLLRFLDGSREAFHTHAFNAVSWVIKGKLLETEINGTCRIYRASWKPIYTPREMFHRVRSSGTTWAISFRGPWKDKWREFLPENGRYITLTHGRKEVTGGKT